MYRYLLEEGKKKVRHAWSINGVYADDALSQHAENALVLNIDEYHKIHMQWQPWTTYMSESMPDASNIHQKVLKRR